MDVFLMFSNNTIEMEIKIFQSEGNGLTAAKNKNEQKLCAKESSVGRENIISLWNDWENEEKNKNETKLSLLIFHERGKQTPTKRIQFVWPESCEGKKTK